MPVVLNHQGVPSDKYHQFVKDILVRQSEATNTTMQSLNSNFQSIFEKNKYKNKMLASTQKRIGNTGGFFGDEAALSGGSINFTSKSEKERYYKSLKELKKLRSKILERPVEAFEVT